MGDFEKLDLECKNNEWYLNLEAHWLPNGGGKITNKLDAGYFIHIHKLDDLLDHIYSGSIAPCRELIQSHKDVLALLDELIQSKTKPNYNENGLSLVWDFNDQHDGIIIHECLSRDKETIEIPDTIENYPVVAFGHSAFTDMNCRALKLPGTLRRLNGIAGCRCITEITIPAMTEECCSFLGCDALENIFVAEGNPFFCSIDGVLYTCDQTTLVRCPAGKRGRLKVSDRTTSIDSWACADCVYLTDVVLPKGLLIIGMDAFRSCTGIRAIELPDCVVDIRWGAFAKMNRDQIICKKGTYAYDHLESTFSNPNWHR